MAAAREAGVAAIVERVDGPKLVGWVRDKSSCQRVVCESEAIRRLLRAQRELLRCRSVPMSVIPNGIDLNRFDPDQYSRAGSRRALRIAPDEFVVGTIARLVPVKNLGHLLDAVHLLLDQIGADARVRLILAGPDGGELAVLRRRARELGIAAHVRFLGARRDVPTILRAFDLFALPSFQEGVPFALLEAMAMGLPVVATQADSIAETVRDNGYLVGPLDPFRTTIAIRELMANPGLCRELGRRSRRLASRHGLDPMVRKYERVLEAAFREGSRRPPFRRRVVVMPGHPSTRSSRETSEIERLFTDLRGSGADVYALRAGRAAASRARWPPARQQWFASTADGMRARRSVLEWIQPDVIVTDCPDVVRATRGRLAGEEIVFLPDPGDPCRGHAAAARIADRVLVRNAAEKRDLVRRWPLLAWKIDCLPAREADGEAAIQGFLARPRPRAGARTSSSRR
jgi:hypothetical protein